MGTSASRSSPSPPTSCSLVETESTTQLFTVLDYSRWARMPAGTALNFDTFLVLGSSYHLKVYPAGLDSDSADFVAIFVVGSFHHDQYAHTAAPARVSLEILDASGKHTVFDDHTARSEQTLRDHKRSKGYVRFVNRREMEASCCVREDDDSLTVRCTISVDREVTRPLVMAPLPLLEEAAEGSATAVGSPRVTVGGFSRLRAALRTGECAYTPRFSLGGSSWYFKVYPNGHCDASKDCVAVFLGRGKSDEPTNTAQFRFELADDLAEEETEKKVEFTKHTFDRDNPVHAVPYLVRHSCLASAEQMDDCFVVQCHLRVIKVRTPRPILRAAAALIVTDGKATTGLGTVGEMEDKNTSAMGSDSIVT